MGTEETGRRAGAAGVGVADGLFAAMLAAGAGMTEPMVVAPGGTARFLAPWPVAVLDRTELTDLLVRLGIDTLGRFAALPGRHVLARFGADGAVCHRVARGIAGDLPGLRLPSAIATRQVRRAEPVARQPGFWGGASAADDRAAQTFTRVEEILGPGTVVLGRIQGGRSPAERARLVPWESVLAQRHGRGGTGTRPEPIAPWPGQLPAPAPSMVFTPPRPAQVEDRAGRRVGVDGRGTSSADPARVSIDGGAWETVQGFAGPWPADERWWAARRRRRARMQVVTDGGAAHLLTVERGRWWLEGSYD
jgi:protein ImuB